ncbi:MAG: hypothetical protein ACE5JA_01045 [bacterium]
MKWLKILGLVVGLAAGILWLVFGLISSLGMRGLVVIFPVVLQSFLVGGAVVVSSLIGWRWKIPGGVLLLFEGIAPLVLLFVMATGYPLFFSIVSGITLLSGLLLLAREGPGI